MRASPATRRCFRASRFRCWRRSRRWAAASASASAARSRRRAATGSSALRGRASSCSTSSRRGGRCGTRCCKIEIEVHRSESTSMIQSVGAALAKVPLCSVVLISCRSAPAASPFSVGLLPDNTPNPVRQPAVGQVSTLFTQVDARIAFVRDRDVYILDATTGIETRLTEGGANSAPRWTTDGTALFFTRNVPGETGRQPSEQTWRWREGTGLEQVQTGVWAPDGSAVAYAQPVSIHDSCISSTWPAQSVWLEARGERVRLTADEPDVHWKPLAWSPDGQRLALARINPCATTRMEKDRRVNEAEARLLVIEGDLFSGRLRELMMPLY